MINTQVALSYDGFSLDIDLALAADGVTAIYGQSGSGKTTLLRCLAGLEHAPKSTILVNGEIWQNANQFLPTHKRSVGFVFQESSLFSHLSVAGNLEYAQKRAPKNKKNEQNQQSISRESIVELLGIDHLLNRKPAQLSGGERQRVAIARALLSSPKLLLMDEPLASLDKQRKREVIPYLKELRSTLNIPVIYVSHALDEIAQLADHLVLLEEGRAQASGPLTEVMSRIDLPLSVGDNSGAVLEVEILEKDSAWRMERVRFSGGELWLRDSGLPVGTVHRVQILSRDVSLARSQHEDTSIQNILPVTIAAISEDKTNGSALIQLKAGNEFLVARVTLRSLARLALKKGDKVWAQIKSVALIQ